jgi:excisionase family DNA binding protein
MKKTENEKKITGAVINENPLDIHEAAAFLRLSKTFMYQLVHDRKIAAYKPGGKKLYFRQCDLENYAFRNKRLSDYEAKETADKILTRA